LGRTIKEAAQKVKYFSEKFRSSAKMAGGFSASLKKATEKLGEAGQKIAYGLDVAAEVSKSVVELVSDVSTDLQLTAASGGCKLEGEEPEFEWGEGFELVGSSIASSGTALLADRGRLGLDAGPPIEHLPLPKSIFVSHHHHDHISGLRNVACRSAALDKEISLFVSGRMPEDQLNWIEEAVGSVEGSKVQIEYVNGGDRVDLGEGRALEFFPTNHSEGSLGVSLMKVEEGRERNYLTYTGDIVLDDERMRREPHLREADNLVVESSYLGGMGLSPISSRIYKVFAHSSFDSGRRFLGDLEEPPDSVTYVHLPYAPQLPLTCGLVERRIEGHRAKDVGYIPTCLDGPGGLNDGPRFRVSVDPPDHPRSGSV
jgi:hypothetical protein